MPSSEYTLKPGRLKIKGGLPTGIEKKRKKKKSKQDNTDANDNTTAVATTTTSDREADSPQAGEKPQQSATEDKKNAASSTSDAIPEELYNEAIDSRHKTEAEKRHEERRRRRLHDRLEREGLKTHKERVEEFNKYLSGLSEHHDM